MASEAVNAWIALPPELRTTTLVVLSDAVEALGVIDLHATARGVRIGVEALRELGDMPIKAREYAPRERERAMLFILHRRGDWTKTAELSQLTNMGRWTTRAVLDRLLARGLVEQAGRRNTQKLWRAVAPEGSNG